VKKTMTTEGLTAPKTIFSGPNRVTYLLSSSQTGGEFSLTEFKAAHLPASAAPIHRHLDADETFYILEGEFHFIVRDHIIPALAGARIFIPRGTPDTTIENIGTAKGRMLMILTPPGFEQFWSERAQQITTYGAKVDLALVLELQQKYKMDMGGQVRQFSSDLPKEE
jgi:mannose-6-phosphate isomerase-like protein (cupin superfamily)